ncbi:unnamed protein product [Cochlearia groenlandica]
MNEQHRWCHDIGREQASNRPLLKTVFQVEIVALSSYEEKQERFMEEVIELRRRVFHSVLPRGLGGDRCGVTPASAFSFSCLEIWRLIKENRDLDLPAHRILVANFRCEEIAREKLSLLETDERWLGLQEAIENGLVRGFGQTLSSTLGRYLSEYSSLSQLMYPSYKTMLGHLRSNALESFITRLEETLNQGQGFANAVRSSKQSCLLVFNEGCQDVAVEQASWGDASNIRDSHSSSSRTAKLSELTSNYKEMLTEALSNPIGSLLEGGGTKTWPSIRTLLETGTEPIVTCFRDAVTSFELDIGTLDATIQILEDYSRSLVEEKARGETQRVIVMRMKENFNKDLTVRVWNENVDIGAITKRARAKALTLLSVMAAIRLDERPDEIKSILFSFLMDGVDTSMDPLASTSWEEVPPKYVLLTPRDCMSLWRQFIDETQHIITQVQGIITATTSKQEPQKQPSTLEVVGGIIVVVGVAGAVVTTIPVVIAGGVIVGVGGGVVWLCGKIFG